MLLILRAGSGLQKYHVHASSNPRQELWKLPVEGQPPAQEIESPFKARQVRKMLYRGLGDVRCSSCSERGGEETGIQPHGVQPEPCLGMMMQASWAST